MTILKKHLRLVTSLVTRKFEKLCKVCHIGDASHRSRLIETVIEKDSKLDILVSNAAVNPYFGSMLDTPEASWDKIFEINVKNAFQLIQESVPHLEKQVISTIKDCLSETKFRNTALLCVSHR